MAENYRSNALYHHLQWISHGARRVYGIAMLIAFCIVFNAREARAQDSNRNLGRELGRISLGGEAESIAWSPDQRRIVVVIESLLSERRRIIAIDATRRSIDWSVDGQDTKYGKAAFLPGGALIVTRSLAPIDLAGLNWNLALSVLDAATGRTIQHIPVDLPKGKVSYRARDFALSEDGTSIAVLTASPWVLGLDTRTWRSLWRIGPLRDQTDRRDISGKKVVLDVRRNRLIVATAVMQAGAIQTWSLSDGTRQNSFVPYVTGLSQMAGSPFNGDVFTGGNGLIETANPGDLSSRTWVEDDPDTLVRAWDPSSGKRTATFVGPGRNVNGLSLSPDGRYVVASKSRAISPPPRARDAHVLIWEQATAKLVHASNFAQGFPGSAAFSPDGGLLALAVGQQLLILELN